MFKFTLVAIELGASGYAIYRWKDIDEKWRPLIIALLIVGLVGLIPDLIESAKLLHQGFRVVIGTEAGRASLRIAWTLTCFAGGSALCNFILEWFDRRPRITPPYSEKLLEILKKFAVSVVGLVLFFATIALSFIVWAVGYDAI